MKILQTRKCTRCRRTKNITEFRRDKGRTNTDGFHPWCKKCHCACEKSRRLLKPPRITKKCIKCGIEKPVEEFGKKRKGKGISRQLKAACKECYRLIKRDRKLQKRETQRAYWQRNINLIRRKGRKEYTKRAADFKAKRDEIKSNAISFKGGKCARCGLTMNKNNPSFCFDFHHNDPSIKKAEPGDLIHRAVRAVDNQKRIDELYNEIKKCDVLCAICHRKAHYEMGSITE